ncbi:MAG: DUF3857 domain-containing protein [Flavobacteriaceae bacterium]
MKKAIICLLFTISVIQFNYGQIKKFGKVTKDDFNESSIPSFNDANAVIIFKERKSHFDHQNERWVLITEVHERIKISNKEGFDYANKSIKLFTQNNRDESVRIKANTYNIVDNKVVKTKLRKKNIYKKVQNKFWSTKSFTMPNLKEGSIVEWIYTITSPFYMNLNDVVFQSDIPTKIYSAKIRIPEYFIFNTEVNKYNRTTIKNSKKNRTLMYSYTKMETSTGRAPHEVKHSYEISFAEKIFEIELSNIKPLIEESYVNNINNYRGKVIFESVGTQFPNSIHESFSATWNEVTKSIYTSSKFGVELNKKKYFKDDLTKILNESKSTNDKISVILKFVKDKIKWNNFYGIRTSDGVSKAYKNGFGNVAEINLILTAMLREAGLDASPVLVSTRSNGIPLFPTIEGFNYVIAGVELDNEIVLLDATEPFSAPNVLPSRVLNWQGRILENMDLRHLLI